jgi:hypothetical protein
MRRPTENSEPKLVMTTIRVPEDVKAALASAAKDHSRSSANMLMAIAREWLEDQGYLPKASTGAKQRR